MSWSKDIKGIYADNKGNVREVDANIKTDEDGNETDIIYHRSESPHVPHDHAWRLNTEN
mgnify:CR=1 FL=1